MQRNVSKGAPDWVRTVPVWSEGSHREIAPGALRRPAHAAVAGQPARRRVPRPLLPGRGRRADRPGARPGPARGRGLRGRRPRGAARPAGARGRGAGRGGEDQRLEGRARRRPGARERRSRTSPPPPARSPPAPSASTPSSPPRPTSRRTGTGGSSSTRPGRARTRSWPPTARASGRDCRCPRRSAGTRWTTCRPADFTVTSAADRFPTRVGGRAAGAADAARRPGRRGAHHPDRAGGGDARGQAAQAGRREGRRRRGLIHRPPACPSTASGRAGRSVGVAGARCRA